MSPEAMGGMGPMHMEAMPPDAMAGISDPAMVPGDMDGDGQPAPGWGDGADTGGGLMAWHQWETWQRRWTFRDAMAGPADPMAGADPMGGAPAFDGAMAPWMGCCS